MNKIGCYQNFWKHLAKLFNLETFIETGTGDGTTANEVRDGFKNVYTIELTDHWYENALRRFLPTNVYPIHGDSEKELLKLLRRLPNTRTLFYLDAHFHEPPNEDGTPGKLINDPLPGEIAAILDRRPDALVAIDDQVDDKLQNVRDAGIDLTGWTTIFDGVRMVLLFKDDSGYYWPPFEG